MVQIFADLSSMQDGVLSIGGEDYNHIKNVLRMRPGEEISVFAGSSSLSSDGPLSGTRVTGEAGEDRPAAGRNSAGNDADASDCDEYRFAIESFSEGKVLCRLLFVKKARVELPVRVILFQGLPKSDKMDFIVQKAVEMGVREIVPVEMHRSIVKLAGDKRRKRTARWQSIAEAAARQSRRALIPEVHGIMTMREAVAYAASSADRIFVPYERMADRSASEPDRSGESTGAIGNNGAERDGGSAVTGETADADRTGGTRALLEALQPGETVAVFIGPEGGFEESEVEMAEEQGAYPISLGRRILRTETAGLAFLSFLIYRFEL